MARRAGRRRREGSGEIPVGSFSDIAFLLIIFFIIAASLNTILGFDADIPATEESQSQQQDSQTPTVSLSSGGRIALDGTLVTLEELRQRLVEMKLSEKTESQDRFIMLESQPGTQYGTFYQVWSAIVAAGGNVALLEGSDCWPVVSVAVVGPAQSCQWPAWVISPFC